VQGYLMGRPAAMPPSVKGSERAVARRSRVAAALPG